MQSETRQYISQKKPKISKLIAKKLETTTLYDYIVNKNI